MFLTDEEISKLVERHGDSLSPELRGADPITPKGSIQACSLDLSVGDIFDPSADDGKLGSLGRARSFIALNQGQTVVIRTKESLRIPDNIGGIAFPPSHVSIKGLLMTNPGHVDPGYNGRLHLTVINMGREKFQLQSGDKIVRVLFFNLSGLPMASYSARHTGVQSAAITDELLSRLSHDFVDVEARAKSAAANAVRGAEFRATMVGPIAAAALTALLTIGLSKCDGKEMEKLDRKVDILSTKVDSIGGDVNLDNINNRIDIIEKSIEKK